MITFSWKDLTRWLRWQLLRVAAGAGLCNDSQQEQELCLPVLGTAARAADLKGAQSRAWGKEEVFQPRDKETECTGLGAEHLQGLLGQKADRTENATPYLSESLCNMSAAGPAKVQGLEACSEPGRLLWTCWGSGCVRSRGRYLQYFSPSRLTAWPRGLAEQLQPASSWGRDFVPYPALQKSRECLSSSEQSNVPAKTSC